MLRGVKTPSPAVAARLAEALGANQVEVGKAVQYAEALAELNSYQRRRSRQTAAVADQPAGRPQQPARIRGSWLALAAAAALVLAFGARYVFRPASASRADVTGTVTCESGRPVIAIWIAALSGQRDSGYAHLGSAVPGTTKPGGPTVTYTFRLAHGGGYVAHVGCGISHGHWDSANFSKVITGQQVTLHCADPDPPHPVTTTLHGTCSQS